MKFAPKLPKKTLLENEKRVNSSSFAVRFAAVTVAAAAVVAIAVLALLALYELAIDGGGDTITRHTFRLLYFASPGDVRRMIVVSSSNNSATVFTLDEGVTVGVGGGANGSSYVFFFGESGSPPLIVDDDVEQRRRASRTTPVRRAGNRIETRGATNVDLESSLLDIGVKMTSGPARPSLTRRGPNGAQITILPNARTIVLERRRSDEVRLMLASRWPAAETAAMQRRLQNRLETYQTIDAALLWEEMTLWPRALNLSVVNLHGTFDFRNEEGIFINSYSQGNFSASPFKHKFGRMTDYGRWSVNHGLLEVIFDEGDDCGRAIYRDVAGDELWIWLKRREAGVRQRASNGGDTLEWKDGRVETSDGALRVDLAAHTVALRDATVDNRTKLCDRWTKWTSSANISVQMKNNCTTNTTWFMDTPIGKFNSEPWFYGNTFRLFHPNNDCVTLDNGVAMVSSYTQATASLSCGYFMDLLPLHHTDDEENRPQINMRQAHNTFLIRAAPARAVVADGVAKISGFAADVLVKPFVLRYE